MEPNGEFSKLYVEDGYYKGKALMDKIDNIVRQAYYDRKNVEVNKNTEILSWYLWAEDYLHFLERCYENI
ncbi:fructose-bisphosphatase class III [Fusobacterium vincentii]|uniref:fructose-bisphosphatase class III n=1 Tax=Fusobacterium vincentii TaxID=155615 RepID=UPI0030CC9C49